MEVGSSGRDQFKATGNRAEPPPNDPFIACSYSDAVLTARSHETRLLKSFSKESQVDPAGCKEIMFSAYGCGETPFNNSDRFVLQYEDTEFDRFIIQCKDFYLDTWLSCDYDWSQRFQARVLVLIECQPHIWIFRARKDIDKVHILVERKNHIGEDWDLVVDLWKRASMLLAMFYGFSWRGMVRTPSALGPIYEFDKLSFIKLEEFMKSEWRSKGKGETLGLRVRHNIRFELSIAKWIRQFDNEIGATAVRITDAWAKAAEIVQYSSYNGIRSLAISFTEDISGSESRTQSHEQLIYCDTAGLSPSEAQDTISAHNNRLGTIWRENYTRDLLPRCENFILNPPSRHFSRKVEYEYLCMHMLSQVVMRLEAIDLQGNHALRQKRRNFVNQAEETLARLDVLYDPEVSILAFHMGIRNELYSDLEAEVKANIPRFNDGSNHTMRKKESS